MRKIEKISTRQSQNYPLTNQFSDTDAVSLLSVVRADILHKTTSVGLGRPHQVPKKRDLRSISTTLRIRVMVALAIIQLYMKYLPCPKLKDMRFPHAHYSPVCYAKSSCSP